MSLGKNQIEKRGCDVHWISSADYCNLRFKPFLKHKLERVVRFSNPASVINYSLAFEAASLQSDVRRMLENHIRARCDSSYVFEILPHETVSASRVGCVHDRTLLDCFLACEASLFTEKVILNLVVSSNIL